MYDLGEPKRIYHTCNGCGSNLQFSSLDVGMCTECPHCGHEIVIKGQTQWEAINNAPDLILQPVKRFLRPMVDWLGVVFEGDWLMRLFPTVQGHYASMFGLLLVVLGTIGIVYFNVYFEIAADTPSDVRESIGGDVANMSLMLTRLNGVITSATLMVVGAITVHGSGGRHRPDGPATG